MIVACWGIASFFWDASGCMSWVGDDVWSWLSWWSTSLGGVVSGGLNWDALGNWAASITIDNK